ncbi:DUF7146 domain-containing protein [Pseudoduganella buxea]
MLKRKNQPCPMPCCVGSVDRFTYDDKFGDGNYFCRHCGAGGGFKLLMAIRNWTARETCAELERYLGVAAESARRVVPKSKQRDSSEFIAFQVGKLAKGSYEISTADEAGRYLAGRGLVMTRYPQSLRFHPSVEYWDIDSATGKKFLVGRYPAMLCCMEDKSGSLVAIQRLYLQDGRKHPKLSCRRMLGNGNSGAAVHLGTPASTLATCEGVENGLAIYIRYGVPVWPAMNAGNLEKLWIPDHVTKLKIYGDNDADSCYDGQASAYALARRISKSRRPDQRDVEVFIPKRPGSDWADVYFQIATYKQSEPTSGHVSRG